MVQSGMFLVITIALITIPATALRSDAWMYMSPCKYSSDCSSSGNPYEFGQELECQNGRCNCSSEYNNFALRYNNESSRFECDSIIYLIFGKKVECKSPEDDTCIVNSSCMEDNDNKLLNPFLRKKYKCVCNDEYIMVDKQCRELEHVAVGEACSTPENGPLKFCDIKSNKTCIEGTCTCIRDHYYDNIIDACITKEDYIEKFRVNLIVAMFDSCAAQSNGLPNLCNEAANMTCMNSKCQCKLDRYYNTDNESLTCESKESFANDNNLTSYRVMPGMYCHTNSDCVEGLTCYANKCSCPHPCEYKAESFSCDCGEVSPYEGAGQPILVGIIGGIVIVAGWLHLIKKQIKKSKAKDYVPATTDEDSNCNNSNSVEYPLQPTSDRSNLPYRIQTTTCEPSPSSSSFSNVARPEKSQLPKRDTASSSYNPKTSYPYSNSELPPTYDSLYAASTAPATATAAAPLPYPDAPSYPTAPPSGFAASPVPYPVAPSYPTAPPTAPATAPLQYPAAPSYPCASTETASNIPREAPPLYTATPVQTDIYQPM